MKPVVSTLTILFDPPFWIGICEREQGGHYEVCKITFGAEPKDYEVYSFLLQSWHSLRFYASIDAAPLALAQKRVNPKRMQRLISRQIANTGMGTKAQQALKLQHSQKKLEGKTRLREQREREKERRFALRQEKRKEKHRGH